MNKEKLNLIFSEFEKIKPSSKSFDQGLFKLHQELKEMDTRTSIIYDAKEAFSESHVKNNLGFSFVRMVFSRVTISAMAITLFLGGVTTTVIASKRVLPDSPLYSINQTLEGVQVAFSFSQPAKTKTRTKLLNKRVIEVNKLIEKAEIREDVSSNESVIKAITRAQAQAVVVRESIAELDPNSDEGEIMEIQKIADEANDIVSFHLAVASSEDNLEDNKDLEPATAKLSIALNEVQRVVSDKVNLLGLIDGSDVGETEKESSEDIGDTATSSEEDMLSSLATSTLEDIVSQDLATSTLEDIVSQDLATSTLEDQIKEGGMEEGLLNPEEKVLLDIENGQYENLSTPELIFENQPSIYIEDFSKEGVGSKEEEYGQEINTVFEVSEFVVDDEDKFK